MLHFGGNNTRLTLRELIMHQLHDPNYQFWSKDDINNHMQRAFAMLYNLQIRMSAEVGVEGIDITYTALAEDVDISSSVGSLRRVVMLEDRTDSQPGPLWHNEQNLEDLQSFNTDGTSTTRLFTSPAYAIVFTQTVSSGVITIACFLRAAPPPTSDRKLRIYIQSIGPDFSLDTGTSGLFLECENAAILLTCIYAKFQEMDNASISWVNLYTEAEKTARRSLRSIKRGPKRIRFTDDD